jgi:hypothetical protein
MTAAVRWYRPGRYFWRGPKEGTEEPNCVEIAARRCQHDVVPGLDPQFTVCISHCGMATGPMSRAEAIAIASTLRTKSVTCLTDIERALILLAFSGRNILEGLV